MSSDHPAAGERPGEVTPEGRERTEAWRRGEMHESNRVAGEPSTRDAHTGRARATVAARAFAALADNVRDYAVFLMDPDGIITFWGEGARLIKWWSREQAEGAHLRLLYLPGGSEDGTAEEHLRSAAERGEYTGEGRRVRNDGSTFWAGITLTALWDEDGTLLGFAKVTRDLTARRAADALLQATAEAAERARIEAESASTAKSGFLATMSHEIRTPLNAVIGYQELLDLETDGPLTPGQRRHLARASASARHLLALITEVLDFSRIEADRVLVDRATVRVGDAVAGAFMVVAPQARARGLDLADAVSGFAAGLAARGDEGRVRQILVNLLANAIKFTERRDGEPGRVTVSAGTATQPSPDAQLSGNGPWIYIRVEDTGSGIAADRLQPIFEPFVQADMTLTRAHGGTGLGLAISRRLARLMGGDVTVRSEVGVGSTFLLWLPAAPVESIEGPGADGYAPNGELSGAHVRATVPEAPPGVTQRAQGIPARDVPLNTVSNALMAELERVLHAFVARVRSDPATPSAHAVAEAQIEDHLASFLADLAGTLQHLNAATAASPHESAEGVNDGSAIQRVIAERHGVQRARLGWQEGELRREFTILREEISAAIRRQTEAQLPGGLSSASTREHAERALVVLAQFLGVAERLSLASYRAATRTAAGEHASP